MTAGASAEAGKSPPRRRARWPLVAMYGLYGAVLLVVSVVPVARVAVIFSGVGLFGLLALIFGVAAATRRALPGGARRAWWLLSVGFLLLNLVPVGLVASGAGRHASPEAGMSAAPSYGDLLRLVAVLPMLAALVTFPRSHATRRDGHKLLLDVVTVVGGSFMLLWYFVLGPVVTSDLPTLTMVVAAAYPIGDLTLIFGATVVVLRGAHIATRRPMVILLVGLLLLVVADSYLGYSKIHPAAANHPALQLAVLMTGLYLLALAGLEQCLAAGDNRPPEASRRPWSAGSRLPYAALAAGCGLLIVVSLRSELYPWGGLIVGGVVMTAAVAVRQFIAMRENHDLITSDSLTGLANRIRLYDGLGRAVDRANRTGERAAVLLIDMDGFKQVNDSLGHDAGDQLLIGFAKMLKASVLGADVVARLGGDEFAIVLNNVGTADNAGAVASRIIAGMDQPVAVNGEPIFPAASIGIAVTEPGRPILAAEILHRADMAMYRAKGHPGNTYRFHDPEVTTEHVVTGPDR